MAEAVPAGAEPAGPPSAVTAQQRAAFDACPDMMSLLSPDGTIRFVSAAVRELLGYQPDQVRDSHAGDYLHPQDLGELADALGSAAPRPAPARLHRLRRSDGTFVWVESTLRPLPPKAGEGERGSVGATVLVATRDVTQRLATEDAARAQTRDQVAVFDAMREGVVVVDQDLRVVSANRAAGEFLHADPHRLLGTGWRGVVEMIDEQGHLVPLEAMPAMRALNTGTTQRTPLGYRRHDGSVIWLAVRAIPIREPGASAPSRVVMLLEDALGWQGSPPARHSPVTDAARAVLTAREMQVLRLLADGLDVTAIASQLHLSLHTARGHVKAVLAKLDARTQLQAVVIGLRTGLLQPP